MTVTDESLRCEGLLSDDQSLAFACQARQRIRFSCALGQCAENRFFFFQAEDGIRDYKVTGVQTCALPISSDMTWGRTSASISRGSLIDWERTGSNPTLASASFS